MERIGVSVAEREITHEYDIAEAVVLDFDRMLGDVDACMARLHAAAASIGIDSQQIREAQAAVEHDGGSFEPLSYIRSQTGADAYDLFRQHFIHAPGAEILYPDAKRFLYMLQYADVPHVIMTYGVSAEWQALKLAACGYPMGCTVVDNPDKGLHLQAMGTQDSMHGGLRFRLGVAQDGNARYNASRLTFIDDKAKAFKTMPATPAYKGFWLQRGGDLLPSQQGAVAGNVQIITSLDELTVDPQGRLIVGDRITYLPQASLRYRRSRGDSYVSDADFLHASYLPLGATVLPDRFDGVSIREYELATSS